MITIRPSGERGHANHGWLDSHFSFSFADYYDPRYMGFRALRVINEDVVAPSTGFPMHPHRDMEIVTYVLSGALAHKDSMGNGSTIRPGEVQRMSAGTGVRHSEFNGSDAEPVHLLQIWIEPAELGLRPGYEEKTFAAEAKRGQLRLIASPDGSDGSVTIHQDARLYASLLGPGETVTHALGQRHAWIQVISGAVEVNGRELKAGDGAAISREAELQLRGRTEVGTSEVLLFDLA